MNRSDRRSWVREAGWPLSLYKRVLALEQEVQESRRLNQRLSDVLDVVTEVLVPLGWTGTTPGSVGMR